MGMSLEEVEENKSKGVVVTSVSDGNAKATGRIVKGLFLVEANGIDVKYKTFDEIMDIFQATEEGKKVELVFVQPNDVFKGPAILNVKDSSGKNIQIKCLKGQNLRKVLLDSRIDVYGPRAGLTNCGGGGSCATCVVAVDNNADWDEKPEFERKKLKKYAENARLSCNTFIEGDCDIVIQPPKIM